MRAHFALAAAAVVTCCAALGVASVVPAGQDGGEFPAIQERGVAADVPSGETQAVLEKRDAGEDEPLEVTNMVYMSPLSYDAAGVYTSSVSQPAARLRKRSAEVLDAQWLHGVASGDPLHDAVVLWTKVTLPKTEPPTPYVTIQYDMSTTADFSNIVARGAVGTGPEVDYIVKTDVTGLEARTAYFYRFSILGSRKFSPIGRTKTFPHPDDATVDNVNLLFASCANMPFGYFNAYRMMAQREAEAVVFLGDYYYEYKDGEYGEGALLDESRIPQPNKELKTLSDYRTRHAQYKSDRDLQAAHQAHPWIAIWDDHEFGDNAYSEGSFNHNPNVDGAWSVRRDAAMQAYFEYMPIRQGRMDMSQKIYRSFAYGTLFDLIMLDTRMDERDEPSAKGEARKDEDRTMLGPTQVQWLKDELTESSKRGAPWRLIGNQVLFSEVLGLKDDTWSNYPAERKHVMDFLINDKINNTVFLTGDVHISLAMDVTPHVYNPLEYHSWSGKGSVAVEFVTPAITAPSIENKFAAAIGSGIYRITHPHIQYANLNRKGYCSITIRRDRVINSWYHLQSLKNRDYRETLGKQLQVLVGENRIDHSKVKKEKGEKGEKVKRSPTSDL